MIPDLSRSAALLGEEAMRRLSASRVAVVGVGGVGSWCAEALARTGVGALALVDDDLVAPSNMNRQCPATAATIGRPKVEAMRERILAVNPACDVEAFAARYPEGMPNGFSLSRFDCVVDAIDSVADKAALILAATEAGVPIVSSMGAALRLDPTKVVVRRFDKVDGDGLARALRRRFKSRGRFPAVSFRCVCSLAPPRSAAAGEDGRQTKGSVMPVTCAFGMALAAEAVSLLAKQPRQSQVLAAS
ncbi:MAG: ThiF family adenylyltransferase [Kiritimatiellae bacterium]|nr:ThiF family adenylyltransferase [Kiritimatiellia bacterium]